MPVAHERQRAATIGVRRPDRRVGAELRRAGRPQTVSAVGRRVVFESYLGRQLFLFHISSI